MTPLQVCEAVIEKRLADREARSFFSGLPDEERHYWIASLYALLMPEARRRRLAAYFTPPHNGYPAHSWSPAPLLVEHAKSDKAFEQSSKDNFAKHDCK